MTDLPPPGYGGDYDRPYDPQYAYPQYAYPQQQYGPPQYVPPPVPPPKKDRLGLVVAAIVAVVVIVGLVVTLVVVTRPDSSNSSGSSVALPAPSDPGPSTLPTGPNIQAIAGATVTGIQFFSALQAQDPDEVDALTCPGASIDQADLDQIVLAKAVGPADVSGTQATMPGQVQLGDGTQYELEVTLREEQTDWCVLSEQKR